MQRVENVHFTLRVDSAILERLHGIVFLFLEFREPIFLLYGLFFPPWLEVAGSAMLRDIVCILWVRLESDLRRT